MRWEDFRKVSPVNYYLWDICDRKNSKELLFQLFTYFSSLFNYFEITDTQYIQIIIITNV